MMRTLMASVSDRFKRLVIPVFVFSAGAGAVAVAQSGFIPQGGEYSLSGEVLGDQTRAAAAVTEEGGFVVWDDNASDDDGFGISVRRLDRNFAPVFGNFRLNIGTAGDQRNPQISAIPGGGAAVVWQGGMPGSQNIFVRFLIADGTFDYNFDLPVNTHSLSQKQDPDVATLANGNLLVVWSSAAQDGHMEGVFGQRVSTAGVKLGPEFPVNQYTSFNQRSPKSEGLSGGRSVVAWVSEQQRFSQSVDLYCRILNADGQFQSNEIQMNTATNVVANVSLSAVETGGFVAAWSELTQENESVHWDVKARVFDGSGTAQSRVVTVNETTANDQFAPRLSAVGNHVLVVWTAKGQDGFGEGVYARYLTADGTLLGSEFRVSTEAKGTQFMPTVASDGRSRFLAVWSGFTGGAASFDLYAQQFVFELEPLHAPSPPYVTALSSSRLRVTWPDLPISDLLTYELFSNSQDPVILTDTQFLTMPLAPNTTIDFRLAYTVADGRRSPLSESASGTTWGEDGNFDGLPDDWQAGYWGPTSGDWPSAFVDSDGDGASNFNEFQAGTDPADADSVLRTSMTITSLGPRLNWNTEPGLIYRVQGSDNLATWTDLGDARLAAGSTDSVLVQEAQPVAYYRVIRLR